MKMNPVTSSVSEQTSEQLQSTPPYISFFTTSSVVTAWQTLRQQLGLNDGQLAATLLSRYESQLHSLLSGGMCSACGSPLVYCCQKCSASTWSLKSHTSMDSIKPGSAVDTTSSFIPLQLEKRWEWVRDYQRLHCDLCDKTLSTEDAFIWHVLEHRDSMQYHCQVCQARFFDQAVYQKHSKTHMGEKVYQCDGCGVGFTNSIGLNRHIKKQTCELVLQCRRHQKRAASNLSQDRIIEKRHEKKKVNSRKAVCDLCLVAFASKSELARHTLSHTGKKEFGCQTCGASYAQSSHLIVHVRNIHIKVAPFQCGHCARTFKHATEFNKHACNDAKIVIGVSSNARLSAGQMSKQKSTSLQQPHICRSELKVQEHSRWNLVCSNTHDKYDANIAGDINDTVYNSGEDGDNIGDGDDDEDTDEYDCMSTFNTHSGTTNIKNKLSGEGSAVIGSPPPTNFASKVLVEPLSSISENAVGISSVLSQHQAVSDFVTDLNCCVSVTEKNNFSFSVHGEILGQPYKVDVVSSHIKSVSDNDVPDKSDITDCRDEDINSGSDIRVHFNTRTFNQESGNTDSLRNALASVSVDAKKESAKDSTKIPPAGDTCPLLHKTDSCIPLALKSISVNGNTHKESKNVENVFTAMKQNSTADDNRLKSNRYSRRTQLSSNKLKADAKEGRSRRRKNPRERTKLPKASSVPTQRPHECNLCHARFAFARHLLEHKAFKHNTDTEAIINRCDKCDATFKNTRDLQRHTDRQTCAQKNFSCSQCDKVYKSLQALKQHISVHTGERPFECDLCGKHFRTKERVACHRIRHFQPTRYVCPDCGKAFHFWSPYKMHMNTHLDNSLKPYSCQHCDRKFADPTGLTNHTVIHNDSRDKREICEHCGMGFTTKKLLGKHRRVHQDKKPHACSLCPARFKYSDSLTIHVRTHTGEKPFPCSICGRAFNSKSNRRAHARKCAAKHEAVV